MAPTALPAYAVISPVRDEIEHFARTVESLLRQEHPPQEWIVVDDGSTDGTRELAESYAARHGWIRVVDGDGGATRARGAPIVRAFNRGLAALAARPEIVVKLDGDLYLPPHYFAWVARVFAADARAGVAGGIALVPDGDGRWIPDEVSHDTVNGVAKAYRAACLDDIGGLPESMGWDGIDEYAARARGWQVHVLTELPVLHYRRRGSKQPWWRARWEEGAGARFMGYRWPFLVVRTGYRMLVERPPVLGGLLLAAGYTWAAATRRPVMPDDQARALLRAEQSARLRALVRGRTWRREAALPGDGPAYMCTARDQEPAAAGREAATGEPAAAGGEAARGEPATAGDEPATGRAATAGDEAAMGEPATAGDEPATGKAATARGDER